MAAPNKKKPIVKKKLFRFYGMFNNINIGPKIHLNGVKVVLHEVTALNVNEAYELYKLHLIHKVGIKENDVHQYLIDLYFTNINVEEIDLETSNHHTITLISK